MCATAVVDSGALIRSSEALAAPMDCVALRERDSLGCRPDGRSELPNACAPLRAAEPKILKIGLIASEACPLARLATDGMFAVAEQSRAFDRSFIVVM